MKKPTDYWKKLVLLFILIFFLSGCMPKNKQVINNNINNQINNISTSTVSMTTSTITNTVPSQEKNIYREIPVVKEVKNQNTNIENKQTPQPNPEPTTNNQPPINVNQSLLTTYQNKLNQANIWLSTANSQYEIFDQQAKEYISKIQIEQNNLQQAIQSNAGWQVIGEITARLNTYTVNLNNINAVLDDGIVIIQSINNYITVLEFTISKIQNGESLTSGDLSLILQYETEINNNNSKNYYID